MCAGQAGEVPSGVRSQVEGLQEPCIQQGLKRYGMWWGARERVRSALIRRESNFRDGPKVN